MTEPKVADLYDVHIRVDKERVPILLGLLDSVTILSMTPVAPQASVVEVRIPKREVRPRHVEPGIRGIDLTMEWIAKRGAAVIHLSELQTYFSAKGFSEDTPSPILSTLAKKGLLKREARGAYALLPEFWRQWNLINGRVGSVEQKKSA